MSLCMDTARINTVIVVAGGNPLIDEKDFFKMSNDYRPEVERYKYRNRNAPYPLPVLPVQNSTADQQLVKRAYRIIINSKDTLAA